jgi:hypothetical protein
MALDALYSVGWELGHDYAHTAVHNALKARRKAVAPDPTAVITDWANWEPGLGAASNLVRPPGGLQTLLDRKPVTIRGLDATTIDRIGTELAVGLAVGAGDIAIGKAIDNILGDPQRALMIATTEMNRAVSVATLDNYADLEVEKVEWFALEGCDDCEGNAEQGPIPLGDEFQSGDTEPPVHPNCRCSLLPWIEDDSEQVRPVQEDRQDAGGEALDSTPVELPEDVEVENTEGEVNKPELSDVAELKIPDTYTPAAFEDLPTLFEPGADMNSLAYQNLQVAVGRYVSSEYTYMNTLLREAGGYNPANTYGQFDQQIKDLRNGLMQKTTLEDTIVYRGGDVAREFLRDVLPPDLYIPNFSRDALPEGVIEKAIGRTVKSNGFLSTAAKTIRGRPSDIGFEYKQFQYEIYIPKGTHGATIGNEAEREFLLPPGYSFTIVKIEQKTSEDGFVMYHVKLVLTGDPD